jgi:hypothetical protein
MKPESSTNELEACSLDRWVGNAAYCGEEILQGEDGWITDAVVGWRLSACKRAQAALDMIASRAMRGVWHEQHKGSEDQHWIGAARQTRLGQP